MLKIFLVIVSLLALIALVSACSPVRTLNALTPASTYVASEGVAYGPDTRDKLDVYQPIETAELRKPAQGWPVVVFFYGGSWNDGERADYKFVGEALASRGMLALVADYRLYPEVRYPDFLHDSAKAVAWAYRGAARYQGDVHRLYVMGHSAGGYNAAMISLDARWLQAEGLSPSILAGWIGLAGPYEFLPMTDKKAQPVFFHPNYPPGTQPIDYVSKASPHAFLAAVSNDPLVNPERNTKQLASRLQAAGVPVTLKIYDNLSHRTLIGVFARPLSWLAPVANDIAAFVSDDKHG